MYVCVFSGTEKDREGEREIHIKVTSLTGNLGPKKTRVSHSNYFPLMNELCTRVYTVFICFTRRHEHRASVPNTIDIIPCVLGRVLDTPVATSACKSRVIEN